MIHDRRRFLAGLTAAALGAATARAQAPARAGKTVRVVIFSDTTAAKFQGQDKVFVDAMREMGWVEGSNAVYDRAYANDDAAQLAPLAAQLVATSPDLIFVVPNPAAAAVVAKTLTIPVVFSAATTPVERGLVKSLAHPGGNVTGVANIAGDLGGKRLQLLKQALPKAKRVGVLAEPAFAYTGASGGCTGTPGMDTAAVSRRLALADRTRGYALVSGHAAIQATARRQLGRRHRTRQRRTTCALSGQAHPAGCAACRWSRARACSCHAANRAPVRDSS